LRILMFVYVLMAGELVYTTQKKEWHKRYHILCLSACPNHYYMKSEAAITLCFQLNSACFAQHTNKEQQSLLKYGASEQRKP